MKLNYKTFWRKSGLKGRWGEVYLGRVAKYKPKIFLEIGVFCGVTARNTCDYLFQIHGKNFNYIGVDLFGTHQQSKNDEIEPKFLEDQKFSNPLKNIYYNYIIKENLNSLKSVKSFLKKYENNINLIAGDSNSALKKINLKSIDFAFIDGGHSYQTVMNDLTSLYQNLKGKNKVLLCDDYGKASYIPEVERAINDFSKKQSLKISVIENRFAEIIT